MMKKGRGRGCTRKGLGKQAQQGSGDRSRIDVHNVHELAYWTKEFGVTREVLKECVEKEGVLVVDVQRHIGRQAIWRRNLGPSSKAVALRLVEHWPGVISPCLGTLGQFTCLSKRTVRAALRKLEADALIATTHRGGATSEYEFVGIAILGREYPG
jgi:hypothetical protein